MFIYSQSCAMTPTKSKAPKKKLKQEKITEHLKTKKKRDRFNGMPEDEVLQRKLPDHLQSDLDIVIVSTGYNILCSSLVLNFIIITKEDACVC